jgi:polyhydroxyalkanoate synthesis repressor PhaR
MIVKKYENRKLYHTATSKYITVQELAKLPLGSFKVVDHKTNQDITMEVLLSALSNSEVENDTKVKVMQHCITELTTTV